MNNEQRLKKEAEYGKENYRALSACKGEFYIKSKHRTDICPNREKCIKYKRFKSGEEYSSEVRFFYVDTFRKCKMHEEKIPSSVVVKNAIYNILYNNDLAISSIYEIEPYMGELDKEAKKIFKALLKRKDAYEDEVKSIAKEHQTFLSAYGMYMDDHAALLVDELYKAIKDYLISNDNDNAEIIARVETCRTMVGYSVVACEKRVKETLKYNKNVVNLRSYKMSDMLRVAENLSVWVSRKCKKGNLNEDKRIMSAYYALDKMLTDRYLINDSLEKAQEWVTIKH